MKRSVLFGSLLVLLLTRLNAQVLADGQRSATTRPIWTWTAEERMAVRFDPRARDARIERALAQRRSGMPASPRLRTASAGSEDRPADVIRGAEHPELLLPFEIFSTFTRAAYARGDDSTSVDFRRDAIRKATDLGLPADFLNVLEREAHAYLVLQRQETELRDSIGQGASDPKAVLVQVQRIEAAECPVRAAAIRRLRLVFGSRFDRFLYTAIAPGVFYDFFEPQRAADLLAQDLGCPDDILMR
jgi:hypothetical protein